MKPNKKVFPRNVSFHDSQPRELWNFTGYEISVGTLSGWRFSDILNLFFHSNRLCKPFCKVRKRIGTFSFCTGLRLLVKKSTFVVQRYLCIYFCHLCFSPFKSSHNYDRRKWRENFSKAEPAYYKTFIFAYNVNIFHKI